jgi:elongation factor 2
MYAEPEYKEEWKVNPAGGTVAFGCAKDRWGFTTEIAQEKGLKFSDVINAYKEGNVKDMVDIIPLHEAILSMVIHHVPAPHIAQAYRVPKIWRGDLNSEAGKAMLECDENGPIVLCVNNISVDPQAGIVATGRLFSGTVEEGTPVYLVNANADSNIQQVCLYMGPYREVVRALSAGNIPALLGLGRARTGETVSSIREITPFEAIRYVSEPVVTIAIEPKHSRDLPKLVSFLNKLAIEDPTLVTKIDEETGEYLISGMGTLHLEIAITWMKKAGLNILTSKPSIIYRETIRKPAGPFEVKTPNKLSRFTLRVDPLEPEVIEMIRDGRIHEGMDKKKLASTLRDLGWDSDAARGVVAVEEHGNILVDVTKGVQRLEQVKGSIYIGFMDSMREGALALEQMRGVRVLLEDAYIHVDPVHIGPGQVIPAVKNAIYACVLASNPTILEPIFKLVMTLPPEQVGVATRILSRKRGKVLSVDQREYLINVIGELPAAESFDLSDVIRSATSGRAFWQTTFSHWQPVPESQRNEVIRELRKRKGLPPELPKPQDFLS